MYRMLVILAHTFKEAVVQPIYSLLIAIGIAILVMFAVLPFFTFGEDTLMFKAVGLDVQLLLVLITTLFATSRSIFDEIEDRTMLTLMSKPVSRCEVLVGKYLGIILAALLAMAILGLTLCLCTWSRVPADYMLNTNSLDDRDLATLHGLRLMHLAGLVPSLLLLWLQVCVLAAVGVALSTRVSLIINLPIVIFVYIAGNLTRFLFPLTGHESALLKGVAYVLATVLPYLEIFDLRQLTVYRNIGVAQFAQDPTAVAPHVIWTYLLLATAYAAAYAFFILSAGMWSFRRRELGGAEG